MRGAVSGKGAGGLQKGLTRRFGWPVVIRCLAASAVCLVFSVACSEASGGSAQSVTGSDVDEQGPTVPGELVVRFARGVSADEQMAFLNARGLTLKRRHLDPEFVTVGLPNGSSEGDVAAALSEYEVVASAEEIGLMELADAPEPNDPSFSAQRWNFSLVQAPQAWEHSRGAGVIVAVIDTGVAFEDYVDPVTQREFVKGPDFTNSTFVYPNDWFDDDDHPNDDHGHGTHVAGTIAEATNNGLEAAGIAHEALIIPIKACGLLLVDGEEKYRCRQDAIAEGIDWATLHGADVINLSLGGVAGSDRQEAAIERAQSAGIVVVASSGNGGADGIGDPELWYPAAYPGVIAVGATDGSGVRAGYSNYGASPEDPERMLDVVAPGGDVFPNLVVQNTFVAFCGGKRPPEVIDVENFASCGARGTSQAAAHVSAVAALILSLQPDLRYDQVRELLQCSARDLGAPGFDPEYGYGMVQAFDAIQDSDGDGVFDCLDRPVDTCGVAASPTPTTAPSVGAFANGMPTPVTTPTPTPSPTDTPTPTPTDGPTPTPTDSATPTESPTPTPTDTPTPTPSPSPLPSPTPGPVACGDVDCDYDVDSVDALRVLRYVAQLSDPECIDKGYTNCDGFINSVDALFILRYVAHFPAGGGDGCPVIGYE